MKKYKVVFVTAQYIGMDVDHLQEDLDNGWRVERSDVVNECIVYILSKEVTGTGETEGYNSPADYLNRIKH